MVDFGIDNLVQYFAGDPINVIIAPGRGDLIGSSAARPART